MRKRQQATRACVKCGEPIDEWLGFCGVCGLGPDSENENATEEPEPPEEPPTSPWGSDLREALILPPEPPGPRPLLARPWVWVLVVAAAVLTTVVGYIQREPTLVAGTEETTATVGATAPAARTLAGSVKLLGNANMRLRGEGCLPQTGYEDFAVGSTVAIWEAGGQVLATTTLGEPGFGLRYVCLFPFSAEVPADLAGYTVAVADRELATYTGAELDAAGWEVIISIG